MYELLLFGNKENLLTLSKSTGSTVGDGQRPR